MSESSRLKAHEIAVEVVDAFGSLYPKLALPQSVWNDLREMIEREVQWQEGDVTEGASCLANDPLYIAGAVASGLHDRGIADAAGANDP